MKTTFRLSVLVLPLVLTVLPGALRGSDSAIAGAKDKLIIFDWPDYDDAKYHEDFEKDNPGVAKVRSWEGDQAIYEAVVDQEHADIIHPYTTWLKRWVDAGLVREIEVDELTNWGKVPEELKVIGRCGLPDPDQPSNQSGRNSRGELICEPELNGKQFFVPWDVGFSSILYLKTKVGEINSWKDLFDERYQGHIAMYDDAGSAVEVYSYAYPDERRKYDEGKITTKQFAELNSVAWRKQKRSTLHYWKSNEYAIIEGMVAGNIWLAYAWPSAYATAIEKGLEVGYANPIEGRISWVGAYGVLKIAKNYPLALEFLDKKLSKTTAQHVIELGYGVANTDVWSAHSGRTLMELSLNDPSVLKETNFPPELTKEQARAWKKMWSQVKKDK